MSNELKPCPFCGREQYIESPVGRGWFWVRFGNHDLGCVLERECCGDNIKQ